MNRRDTNRVTSSFGQVADVLFPLCLHFVVQQLLYMLVGNWMEAGMRVTLAAGITAVPLTCLYRKELHQRKKALGRLWIPFVVGAAGNAVCSALFAWLHLKEYFADTAQETLFQSLPIIQIAGLGILVPVVEELIFRGLICGKLQKYYGTGAAVLFSTLLFAAYHGNMIQMLYALPMGVLLAWSYLKWGTLAAPVLLHMGANLYGVVGNLISA